mgnify:CR=1 FL=1
MSDDMDYFEFENWLNSPVEWNTRSAQVQQSKMKMSFPDQSTHKSYSLRLKNWQLALITRALVGRLKDGDDELIAKRLGYNLMKERWSSQKWQLDYAEKMGNIVDEELEDMKDDFDELQRRVWEEQVTGQCEVEIEVEEAE